MKEHALAAAVLLAFFAMVDASCSAEQKRANERALANYTGYCKLHDCKGMTQQEWEAQWLSGRLPQDCIPATAVTR